MKKTIVASIVLIIAIVCPLTAKGTIGLGGGYKAFLDKSGNLSSQGFSITVTGTNPFDYTDTFGVEYSISKPFMYNRFIGASNWSFGTRFYTRFRPIEKLNISAYAGFSFETTRKTDIISSQLSPSIAAGFGYEIFSNVMVSALFEYSTPALRMYGNTVKSTWFSIHIATCSLFASYIY